MSLELAVQLRFVGLVGLAMLLGAAIGLERELRGKPAGLRTHMMVAGAAALLMGLGEIVIRVYGAALGDAVRSDPIRAIQAVTTGVSFLGAGTIIFDRSSQRVEGLTTAASILFTAGLGMCVALSQLALAVGVAALALVTLRVLVIAEAWLGQRRAGKDEGGMNGPEAV